MEEMTFYYIKCPVCQKPTTVKVYKDTVLLNFPLTCFNCKKDYIISVVNRKMSLQKNSDTKEKYTDY